MLPSITRRMSPSPDQPSLLSEQVDYYRARAAEYDEWFLREGRYFRGEDHRRQWLAELGSIRQVLLDAAPLGDTLELACGTGQWTGTLATVASSVHAVDAVAETIELNRRKHPDANIEFAVADLFDWEPPRRYGAIFFGFWLSHVPDDEFDRFWDLLDSALLPGGRVFFVDSLKAQRSTARDHRALDDSGVVERRLNSGKSFRIVKHFHEPEALRGRLATLGWEGEVRSTGEFFYLGRVRRSRAQ